MARAASISSSASGQRIWTETQSERAFHLALLENADEETKHLLNSIAAYERFSRFLQDAFEDCLYLLTKLGGKVRLEQMAADTNIRDSHAGAVAIFDDVESLLASYDQANRFHHAFSTLIEPMSDEDWINALLEHHTSIQRGKPPGGKSSWMERFEDGSVVIRPLYRRNHPGKHSVEYVHPYRTVSIQSFLADLGRTSAKAEES